MRERERERESTYNRKLKKYNNKMYEPKMEFQKSQ